MPNTQENLKQIVTENPIVLFMKGNKDFPMCGFSARVTKVLELSGVENYMDINVLEDEDIREGVKEFSNWPTIPQLYINGEFIGGCDIIVEMYQAGELQEIFTPKA